MLILCPLPLTDDASPLRWLWVRSRDGLNSDAHGEDDSTALPRDADCVLVLPPRQVRWHHVQLPPHPIAKRAAVLTGLLDAAVLGEPEQLHAALPPDVRDSGPTWVAITDRAALQHLLAQLQAVGLRPHRIVPLTAPSDTPQAVAWPHGQSWSVSLSTTQGVLHIGPDQDLQTMGALHADWASALRALRCPTALAASVETAWPQHPVQVLAPHALLLQAWASSWNLAQFAFRVSAAQRRTQGLQNAWRQLRHASAWRPVRLGLALAMVAALVLPPSLAWRESQVQRQLAQQTQQAVRDSFPDMGLVIDAVLQMRRAVDALARTRGGDSGQGLVDVLGALGQLPQARLLEVNWQSQTAELRLQGTPLNELQQQLAPLGWQVSAQGPDRWRLSRLAR